ncbi:GNAT family N-acetyltransferase [Leptolyngbya ohadii]|uniref:GNAT family N-acetyltransferase n=1 Tax=Leptolyngbya ohadii TaxID=1962290 RepID=UPI0019D41513|nr:GNAT family N-acetyltransferase [Leptolyngbya ohadii]
MPWQAERQSALCFLLRSDDALVYWSSLLPKIADRQIILLAALQNDPPLAAAQSGRAVGTVQLHLAMPPNQPHRTEVAKLLVHRSARRQGIGRLLMQHLETVARQHHRSLLTLDTQTATPAASLYQF